MDTLRVSGGKLITTDDIAGRIIGAKGFDAADAALRKAIGEQAFAVLRSFRKQGTVEQVGLGRGGEVEAGECSLACVRTKMKWGEPLNCARALSRAKLPSPQGEANVRTNL